MTRLIMSSYDYVFRKLKEQVFVVTTICSLFLGSLAHSSEVSFFKTNATSNFGSSFSSGVYDHANYCLPLKPQTTKNNALRKNKPKQSYENAFKNLPMKEKVSRIGESGTDVEVHYLRVDDFVDRPNRKNHFVRLMCFDPKQQQECFIYFSTTHPGDLKDIIKTCREMQAKEHDWVKIKDYDDVALVQVTLDSESKWFALKTEGSFTFDVLGPSGNGEIVKVQSSGSSWEGGLGPSYQTKIYFPLSQGVIEPSMDHQGFISLFSGLGVK